VYVCVLCVLLGSHVLKCSLAEECMCVYECVVCESVSVCMCVCVFCVLLGSHVLKCSLVKSVCV